MHPKRVSTCSAQSVACTVSLLIGGVLPCLPTNLEHQHKHQHRAAAHSHLRHRSLRSALRYMLPMYCTYAAPGLETLIHGPRLAI